ncbi:MAG: DUF971 domain-containing protein [Planctomycetota bacterium]
MSPMPQRFEVQALRQVDADHLGIRWADGHESTYPVLYLRGRCACAQCVDEMTGQRRIGPFEVVADVKPVRIAPVGRYALGILWSDGHDSGIYTFERLRALCPCDECRLLNLSPER